MKPKKIRKRLEAVLRQKVYDYEPWGVINPEICDRVYHDCSEGCKYFIPIQPDVIGNDYGVCTNPRSHRHGLLTFEHQGCGEFKK